MRRLSLISAAVLGLAALSPAVAQQTGPAPTPATATAQPAPPPQPPAAAPEQPAGGITGVPAPAPVPEQAEHQVRAGSLLGVEVSDGEATIGEVSDLVVTEDGRVEAVVVGVGGFLGIGQKRVALAWDSIKLTEQDGRRVILVSATREQLEGMPTFKTLEERRAEKDAAAAQRQMQQQPGVAPGVTPGLTPLPPPQPGNQ
jgi:hypothetical protein